MLWVVTPGIDGSSLGVVDIATIMLMLVRHWSIQFRLTFAASTIALLRSLSAPMVRSPWGFEPQLELPKPSERLVGSATAGGLREQREACESLGSARVGGLKRGLEGS